MIRLGLASLLIVCACYASAQDLSYVKRLVDTLTSESYHGRGYVRDGGLKAARFIQNEFVKAGLENVHFQPFKHPINTFPGKLEVAVDGNQLTPAVDYLVVPTSKGSGPITLKLVHLSVKKVKSLKRFKKFVKKVDWSHSALVIPEDVFTHIGDASIGKAIARNDMGAQAIIRLNESKLTWSVRGRVQNWIELEVLAKSLPEKAKTITVEIEQEFVPQFDNRNVIGQLTGTKYPDSFIVFSAHYDHLGRMGKEACFYGANDNAGGAAMLCDLAQHYAQHPELREYSILFIAFAGEEAGLLGSKYYVDHPEIPLSNMSLLINLDLVTTGEDGMTVVNGRLFKPLLTRIRAINDENGWMKKVGGRGKAANSDHYHFGEKGVRAIFIYLLGDYPHYHDINDTADKPSWAGYENFFSLILQLCADQSR